MDQTGPAPSTPSTERFFPSVFQPARFKQKDCVKLNRVQNPWPRKAEMRELHPELRIELAKIGLEANHVKKIDRATGKDGFRQTTSKCN